MTSRKDEAKVGDIDVVTDQPPSFEKPQLRGNSKPKEPPGVGHNGGPPIEEGE